MKGGYLQQAVAAHCPVTRPVALVCGSDPKAVAPPLHHVEALGMPNVSLQPDVLPLAAVELQKQISVVAAGLSAPALCLFLLLLLGAGLKTLLSLEEDTEMSMYSEKDGSWNTRCRTIF